MAQNISFFSDEKSLSKPPFGVGSIIIIDEKDKMCFHTGNLINNENAEKIIGLAFNEAERDSMLENLDEELKNYEKLRNIPIPNDLPPALVFDPRPIGFKLKHPESNKF